MKLKLIFSLTLLTTFSLTQAGTAEWEAWKSKRAEALQQPNGWLSLVGMEWLKVGKNSIGSNENNDVVLSHGPGYLGDFYMNSKEQITFTPNQGSGIKVNGETVTETLTVHADSSDKALTVFTIDTFEFFVIERDKMALRIKDSQAKTRTDFNGLSYFPENESLRLKARFEAYNPEKIIPFVNVMGQLNETTIPGRVIFTINGQEHDLDVIDSEDDYYIVFGDKTNGRTTYGPGRTVYTDGLPNEAGEVVLDFNKAYNPPCAFTVYSTCFLPPAGNRIPEMIEAGELKYGDGVY